MEEKILNEIKNEIRLTNQLLISAYFKDYKQIDLIKLLNNFGVSNKDISNLLNTSEGNVRVAKTSLSKKKNSK